MSRLMMRCVQATPVDPQEITWHYKFLPIIGVESSEPPSVFWQSAPADSKQPQQAPEGHLELTTTKEGAPKFEIGQLLYIDMTLAPTSADVAQAQGRQTSGSRSS